MPWPPSRSCVRTRPGAGQILDRRRFRDLEQDPFAQRRPLLAQADQRLYEQVAGQRPAGDVDGDRRLVAMHRREDGEAALADEEIDVLDEPDLLREVDELVGRGVGLEAREHLVVMDRAVLQIDDRLEGDADLLFQDHGFQLRHARNRLGDLRAERAGERGDRELVEIGSELAEREGQRARGVGGREPGSVELDAVLVNLHGRATGIAGAHQALDLGLERAGASSGRPHHTELVGGETAGRRAVDRVVAAGRRRSRAAAHRPLRRPSGCAASRSPATGRGRGRGPWRRPAQR